MHKQVLSLVVIALSLFVIGCNSADVTTLKGDGSMTFADRVFSAGETKEFVIESDVAMYVGFKSDLDDKTKAMLKEREKADMTKGFAGKVSALDTHSGISGMYGGYIKMDSVEGKIRFTFENLLNQNLKCEVFAKPLD